MEGVSNFLSEFRGSTLVAALLVLLLIAVAHFGLRWYSRRRERRRQEGADAQLFTVTLTQLLAPIVLLLWLHGLLYALTELLGDLQRPVFVHYGMQLLRTLRGVGTVLALMWLLSRVGRVVESQLVAFSRRSHTRSDDLFLPIVGTAIRLLLPLLAIILGSSMLEVPPRLQELFRNGSSMLLIGIFSYVLYRIVGAACDLILERHPMDVPDNREARGVYTQVTVLRKVAVSVIVLIAFAAMLMVFDEVRQLGTTILASAGVAGIVIGFAAQRSLAALLAGFQIALTQPIRIDDVVVVEGEWGKIEEITLTYVVVSIWDERRLVVPISWFLEKPFQNWTRTSVELLGTVELYVDYDVPIDALRARLTEILDASKFWDRRVNVLQVTDATERSVKIRALVSARDSGAAWDLRCEVREALLRFLQAEQPSGLPRLRLARAETGPKS